MPEVPTLDEATIDKMVEAHNKKNRRRRSLLKLDSGGSQGDRRGNSKKGGHRAKRW
jgi:hypothetical protein